MNLLTPAQCRAARALLDLSAETLCTAAAMDPSVLADFEAGRPVPSEAVASAGAALEALGIEFVGESNGKGVGLRFAQGSLRSEGLTPAELNATNDD